MAKVKRFLELCEWVFDWSEYITDYGLAKVNGEITDFLSQNGINLIGGGTGAKKLKKIKGMIRVMIRKKIFLRKSTIED